MVYCLTSVILTFSLVLLIFSPLVGIIEAESSTIVVPDDCPTIQQAIDNAGAGGVVFVKNGTYFEHILITKSLSLVGENWESTIIDANKTGTPIRLSHGNVTVTGFTICNGSGFDGGIDFWARVDCCNITKNRLIGNPYGVAAGSSSNTCIIGNYLDGNGVGVELDGAGSSGFNNISCNEIVNSNTGISVMYSNNNSVTLNHIQDCKERSIFLMYSVNNSFIANSIVDSKDRAVAVLHSNMNIFVQNSFVNNVNIGDGGWVMPPYGAASVNIWDQNGKGNFWSTYNGIDNNGDNIGDTPYIINEVNQDNFPLMESITSSENEQTIDSDAPLWMIAVPLLLLTAVLLVIFRKKLIGNHF